jgi:hypothetical protein
MKKIFKTERKIFNVGVRVVIRVKRKKIFDLLFPGRQFNHSGAFKRVQQ